MADDTTSPRVLLIVSDLLFQARIADAIVAYFMTLKSPAADNPVAGDAAAGERFFTGKGNCNKPDMRMELFKRAELDVADDDLVDAWWLRAMALDHYGHPPLALPVAHRSALAKVSWPELREPAA